ncbi:MAG TPA: hypothetical protein VMY34_06355 [Acidimicrobiales bacterium]|nr:hypothetical protein [Acidimicrobiales bacterium]
MKKRLLLAVLVSVGLILPAFASPASASHSWGTYHWGRTANPFTVKYGDNVTSVWDSYLTTAASDWSSSTVLNMSVVAGTVSNVKQCTAPTGRVEVCNSTYGFNGWLGIAGISVSGGHIVSGYTKLNDSYFNTSTYNKPEWRALVTCQEIGHNVGLAHQDENNTNANLGSCMDYTNNPLGPPSNTKPNAHDYDQLVAIYGGHTDSSNTMSSTAPLSGPGKSAIVTGDGHGNNTVIDVFWAPFAPQA